MNWELWVLCFMAGAVVYLALKLSKAGARVRQLERALRKSADALIANAERAEQMRVFRGELLRKVFGGVELRIKYRGGLVRKMRFDEVATRLRQGEVVVDLTRGAADAMRQTGYTVEVEVLPGALEEVAKHG